MSWQTYEIKRRMNNEKAAALLELFMSGKDAPPSVLDFWLEERRLLQDKRAVYEDQKLRAAG